MKKTVLIMIVRKVRVFTDLNLLFYKPVGIGTNHRRHYLLVFQTPNFVVFKGKNTKTSDLQLVSKVTRF